MADKQRQNGTAIPAAGNESHKRKAEKDVDKPENAKILKTAQIKPQPTVFIQAMVVGDTEDDGWGFLVGKRAAAPGIGMWAFPGGPLPFGKSIQQTAIDYVLEQSGLTVDTTEDYKGNDNSIFDTVNDVVINSTTRAWRHLVTVFVICLKPIGQVKQPQVCKPDVYSEWEFRSWEMIPGSWDTFSSLIELKRKRLYVDWDNEGIEWGEKSDRDDKTISDT